MQTKFLMDGFIKILKICCKSGFFRMADGKISPSIQYGPLGSLLRRNIKREWLSSIIHNTDASMFPLEMTVRNQPQQLQFLLSQTASAVLPEVFENYFKMLPLFGSCVPFGFVSYGSSSELAQDELHNNSFLKKLEPKHWLTVVFFCPQKKSSDWFNYWSRYRYRWWRKFSSLPSKFFMSDVTETLTGDQQISLMMEFPWGKEKIETITLHNNEVFEKCCCTLGFESEEEQKTSVIFCQAELDLAAMAYLCNSFTQKWRDGEISSLFQLHVKLTPYKVSVLLSDDGSDLKKLKDVACHLEKQLKKSEVAVFPFPGASLCVDTSHFNRLDEMGVPYTIVLNEKALNSGIAGLRNRDTTLEEQIHIAELTPKILKYLQMKSHGTNEC